MIEKRITVFISYSWDGLEHQQWVLELAKDLMERFGIDVILDQFELSAGGDLNYFMESSIEKADKVLVILTPNYKTKAEKRSSGVGYESSMISQEIFESPITKVKFIPVLRQGTMNTSSPKFLKSKLYSSFVDDSSYLKELYKLAMIIYGKPTIEKPELGDVPDFKSGNLDPIIDMAKSLTDEESLNNEINSILESSEGSRQRAQDDETGAPVQVLRAACEAGSSRTRGICEETRIWQAPAKRCHRRDSQSNG